MFSHFPSLCRTSREWFSVNFTFISSLEYAEPHIFCMLSFSFAKAIPSPTNKTLPSSDKNPTPKYLPSENIKFLFFLLNFAIPTSCHSPSKNDSIELSEFIRILILLSYSGEGGSSEYVPAIVYSLQLMKETATKKLKSENKTFFILPPQSFTKGSLLEEK